MKIFRYITTVVAFVVTFFGLPTSQLAWGMEVDAQGTYVDEASTTPNTWHGRFLIGGTRLAGSLTLAGLKEVHDAKVEGTVTGEAINFSFTESTPLPAFFSGELVGNDLQGTYTLAQHRGAWQGTWALAPGKPAPEVPAVATLPPSFFTEPEAPPEARPDDPFPVCRLLRSKRAMLLSGAGRMALERMCRRRPSLSSVSPMTTLRAWVTDRLFPFLGLAQSLAPAVPPALAQACGPQSNPINCRATDTYPRITQNEVSIGVSGANPQIIVVGYNDSGQFLATNSFLGYSRSTDYGSNWTDMGHLPPPANGSNLGDPLVVSDAAGRFYFGHVACQQPGATGKCTGDGTAGRFFIGVSVSPPADGGQAFGLPADASPGTPDTNTQDKPEMAVDRRASGTCPDGSNPCAGNVYVCWSEFNSSQSLSRILFSRSTNQGQSYPPVEVLPLTGFGDVQGCSVAVGPQGQVYVGWQDFSANEMRVRRSTNGGLNFGNAVDMGQAVPSFRWHPFCGPVLTRVEPPDPRSWKNDIRDLPFANLAADPLNGNNVYAVWGSWAPPGDWYGSNEVLFSRSTDGGQSWSAAVRLNDVTTGDQFQPRIATTIWNGATWIKVIWYDRRLDPANLNVDVFTVTSVTGGETWAANARVTDVSLPLPQLWTNFDCEVWAGCYFGDYIGLWSRAPAIMSGFIMGWGDTRLTASGTPGWCPPPNPWQQPYPGSSPDPDVRVALGC